MSALPAALIDEANFQWLLHNEGMPFLSDFTQAPDPNKHLLAGVGDVVMFINQTLQQHLGSIYLKGLVAAGKSTTLKIVAALAPNCVLVSCDRTMDQKAFDDAVLQQLKKKFPNTFSSDNLRTTLQEEVPDGAVVFVDEAHIPFSLAPATLNIIKEGCRCRFVFCSTTAPAAPSLQPSPIDLGLTTIVPDWRMTVPVARAFVGKVMLGLGGEDVVKLADFLIAVSEGHRGLFVELLGYAVQGPTSIGNAVSIINTVFCQGELRGRAVNPNGHFTEAMKRQDVPDIVKTVAKTGSVQYDRASDDMRHLVTIGTLAGGRTLEKNAAMTFPNPFFARAVLKLLSESYSLQRRTDKITSSYDWLVCGLCNFGLESLFSSAPGTTSWIEREKMDRVTPYELQIDQGIADGIHFCTGVKVRTGFNSKKGTQEGKPDVVVEGCVIEFVLLGNSVEEHYRRFDTFPAYSEGDPAQLLVVFAPLGSQPPLPTHRFSRTSRPPPDIVVMSFTRNSFWEFVLTIHKASEVALDPTQPKPINGSSLNYTHSLTWTAFTGPKVPVDFVARHLLLDSQTNPPSFSLTTAQQIVSVRKRYYEESEYFVRVELGGISVMTDVAQTLKSNNFSPTIDGLKKMVLKELSLHDKGVQHLEVYPASATKGTTPCGRMSEVLQPASEDKPYHVVVS